MNSFIIRYLYICFFASILSLFFVSCDSEETEDDMTDTLLSDKPCYLSVSNTTLCFLCDGGTQKLNLRSQNVDWEITGVPQWAKVSPLKGKGDAVVTIECEDNSQNSMKRSAVVNVRVAENDVWNYSCPFRISQASEPEPATITQLYQTAAEYFPSGVTFNGKKYDYVYHFVLQLTTGNVSSCSEVGYYIGDDKYPIEGQFESDNVYETTWNVYSNSIICWESSIRAYSKPKSGNVKYSEETDLYLYYYGTSYVYKLPETAVGSFRGTFEKSEDIIDVESQRGNVMPVVFY